MTTYSLSATLMTHSLRYWFIGILLITTPLFARADLLSDLQAQVQALLTQIATLQAQQGASTPSQTSTATPTASSRQVACPVLFNAAMRFQDRDNPGVRNVRELQIFLATHYGVPRADIVTGFYGKVTENHVKRFQRENGIEETGIVGIQTRNAIQRVCGSGTAVNPVPATPLQEQVIPVSAISVDSSNVVHLSFSRMASACLQMKDSQGSFFSLTSSQFSYSCGNSTLFTGYELNLAIPQSSFGRPINVGQYYQVCNADTRGNSYAACSNPVLVTSFDAASITVTSPNGGESIALNQKRIIEFKAQGLKSYSVALYRNDQWQSWIGRDVSVSNPSILDTFGYPWTPQAGEGGYDSVSEGRVWKIYITGLKADGTGYVDDKSDAPFSFTSSGSGSTNETPVARLLEIPTPTVSPEGTIQFIMNVEVVNLGSEHIYVPLSTAVTSSGGSAGAGAVFMIYDGANNNVTSNVSSTFTRLSGGTETGNTVQIAPGSSARFQLSAVVKPADTSQHFLQLALIGWGETENMTPTRFISPSNFRTPSAALFSETSTSPLSCTLNGATVAHGATKRFWERRYSETCGQIFQDRTCRNGTLSGNAKYDVAQCSKPLGVYRGYMNGNIFITTRDITEAEALTNCKRNANDNPSKTVTCTWEGRTIYPLTTSSAAPSSFLTQVDSSSQTASTAALSELLQQLSAVLNQMVAALSS